MLLIGIIDNAPFECRFDIVDAYLRIFLYSLVLDRLINACLIGHAIKSHDPICTSQSIIERVARSRF